MLSREAAFCSACGQAVAGEATGPGIDNRGAGAVAVGPGSKAVGAKGVIVGRDFHGNIYQGPPPKSDREAIRLYLECVVCSCRNLRLRAIAPEASSATDKRKDLELSDVYVSLDTLSPRRAPEAGASEGRGVHEQMPRPDDGNARLSALEAVAGSNRVVLIGAPGSGKSSFVEHLGLCLAMHAIEPKARWLGRVEGWPKAKSALLPIYVTLRDLAVATKGQAGATAQPRHVWDFVTEGLKGKNLASAAEPLLERLREGGALVIFDGLDEIAGQAHAGFVIGAVQSFADHYPRSPMVVTRRKVIDGRLALRGFEECELAPFDTGRIARFVDGWHRALVKRGRLSAADAADLEPRLAAAVRRPELAELAPNPLLLTVMAHVHTAMRRLPDSRARLYREIVDIFLFRWDGEKASAGPTGGLRCLLTDARATDADLLRVLARLAFEAHASGDGGSRAAGIAEIRLEKALAELHSERSRDWAVKVIGQMKERAGLLIEDEKLAVFTFPHRSFQEYLAGLHLLNQGTFARDTAERAAQPALWRLPILFAVGELVERGDLDRPVALLGELATPVENRADADWRRAWMAGEALVVLTPRRAAETRQGATLERTIIDQLRELVEAGALEPVEREEAAIALGTLGDPRPGVRLKDGLLDVSDFVELPSGRFQLKVDGKERVIKRRFRLGRYPVTVEQYERFLAAGGYTDDGSEEATRRLLGWWTEEGLKWKRAESISGPIDYDPVFQTPNHPRVGVSGYEAMAYCRWLTVALRAAGELPAADRITLPSEADWEWAARWNRTTRTADDRRFPWGDATEDLPQRCNMDGTGIGHTCAVGLFPLGKGESGAMDLSGNVWEWCSEVNLGNGPRVVRGGSWRNVVPDYLSCGCRIGVRPASRYGDFGFRCVWVSESAR